VTELGYTSQSRSKCCFLKLFAMSEKITTAYGLFSETLSVKFVNNATTKRIPHTVFPKIYHTNAAVL